MPRGKLVVYLATETYVCNHVWFLTCFYFHTLHRSNLLSWNHLGFLSKYGFYSSGGVGHSLRESLCFQTNNMFITCFFQQSSSGDLMIRNIQLKHSGKYVCMVQTGVDSVSSAADLIVRGKH